MENSANDEYVLKTRTKSILVFVDLVTYAIERREPESNERLR